LAVGAALAVTPQTIEPGLNVGVPQTIEPLGPEPWHDVVPACALVRDVCTWSQVWPNDLLQPVGSELAHRHGGGRYRTVVGLLVQLQPLRVNLIALPAVDPLTIPCAIGLVDPDVSREAVAVREDRALAVVPCPFAHDPHSATLRATYSSTHSGRTRRWCPSLTERI